MFEKIENAIVLVSRGILIVLAILALVLGILSFIYGVSLAVSKADQGDFRPNANIQKFDESYLSLNQEDEDAGENASNELIPIQEIELAKKIQRNLAKNFKNQTDLSRYITVKNSYEFRLELIETKDFLGIEIENEVFLEMLVNLSSESENSYVLDRVSRYDDVAKVLKDLQNFLILEIYYQYNEFNSEKLIDSQRAEDNKNLGYGLMLYSSIGIAIFIVIILYIILFKIEINIRKISEKIGK